MLLIRADADTRMGTGHVMRCLALAQAWQDAGGQVTFLSASLPPALETRLGAEGMTVVTLDADAVQTARTARELGADWIVLDGYHFDAAYQKALKDAGARLLVLDDNGDTDFYWADLVLNQNVHARAEWYASRAPDTRLLLGTRYALLRREFLTWRGWQRETTQSAYKVLVTLGGSDPENVSLRVLESLVLVQAEALDVTIVIGGGNPHRASLEAEVGRASFQVRLVTAADMPPLMAGADLAVSAGGSTCWELAFMGLPALLLVTAENQSGITQALTDAGAAESLGWARDVTPSVLAEALTRVRDDREGRERMSQRAKSLVDGRGAERVLQALNEGPMRLRRAVPDDCQRVWEWANDPTVRDSAFSSEPISWEEHQQWFSKKLQDAACFFFIALDDHGQPVGQIRFDISLLETGAKESEVDVSIGADRRGQGLGTTLIREGVAELARLASPHTIRAHVKVANLGSRRAFAAAGFVETGVTLTQEQPTVSFRYRTEDDPD